MPWEFYKQTEIQDIQFKYYQPRGFIQDAG